MNTFIGDGTGRVSVFDAAYLEILNIEDPEQGTRCSFHIGPDSFLVHEKNLYISGNQPFLQLEGTLIAESLSIGRLGHMKLMSHSLDVKSVTLYDNSLAEVTVIESDGTQQLTFSTLTLGFGAEMTFVQPVVKMTGTRLEMLSTSVLQTIARPAYLHVVVNSAAIHNDAIIAFSNRGADSMGITNKGEEIAF